LLSRCLNVLASDERVCLCWFFLSLGLSSSLLSLPFVDELVCIRATQKFVLVLFLGNFLSRYLSPLLSYRRFVGMVWLGQADA